MTTSAQEIAETEVSKRLESIAFHYVQHDTISKELSTCGRTSHSVNPLDDEGIRTQVTRIENEQMQMVYELVHLLDNVKKYFLPNG